MGAGARTDAPPRHGFNVLLRDRREALVGIEDPKKAFVKSITGFRMPMVAKINATVQYNVDWENQPASGRVSTDRTVLLTLGYQF